jgi:hypothetical protein
MTLNDSACFAVTALRMSAGIIVWAVHFGVIYGFTGLACARRYEPSGAMWVGLVPWVIGIATVLAAAIALKFVLPLARRPRDARFVDWMTGWVAVLAIGAIVLEAITVLWVPACG